MKFVIDTNSVFSAVLNTEGKRGELLMNSHEIFDFCACGFLRTEVNKHQSKLLSLSKLTEAELDVSIYQITKGLSFTDEALIPFEI